MKKIILFLLALILVFPLVPKISRAWDYGCLPGDLYSRTTGQYCGYNGYTNYNNYTNYTNYYDSGCNPALGPYSQTTGRLCAGNSPATANAYAYPLNLDFYLGQTGSDVITLQQFLQNAGYSVGGIDGVFGPKTKNALIMYKSRYGGVSPVNPVYPIYGTAPTVSSVSGPQNLNINQMGTWTVNAYTYNNTYNGNNLTYSVNWGDQYTAYPYYSSQPNYLTTQQSATFTHVYYQSGTYNVIFTVTNSSGQTAQSSLTVTVGNSNYYNSFPVLYSLSPQSGQVGTSITLYGARFNLNSCSQYSCVNYNATNTVTFGGITIPNVYSYDGTSISLRVPTLAPGVYPVSVTNNNGSSNTLNFQVY